jgi:hypothetical protein
MDDPVRLALAFGLALLLSVIATPLARRLALRTGSSFATLTARASSALH